MKFSIFWRHYRCFFASICNIQFFDKLHLILQNLSKFFFFSITPTFLLYQAVCLSILFIVFLWALHTSLQLICFLLLFSSLIIRTLRANIWLTNSHYMSFSVADFSSVQVISLDVHRVSALSSSRCLLFYDIMVTLLYNHVFVFSSFYHLLSSPLNYQILWRKEFYLIDFYSLWRP